jgi:hypothetical protein
MLPQEPGVHVRAQSHQGGYGFPDVGIMTWPVSSYVEESPLAVYSYMDQRRVRGHEPIQGH